MENLQGLNYSERRIHFTRVFYSIIGTPYKDTFPYEAISILICSTIRSNVMLNPSIIPEIKQRGTISGINTTH